MRNQIFIFVLLLILTGCGGGGGDPIIPPPDDATYEQIVASLAGGGDKFDEATFGGSENPFTETITWLKTQPGIKDAGISSDGTTIWIEYTDSSRGEIVTSPLTEGKLGQGFGSRLDGFDMVLGNADACRRVSTGIVGVKKALILEATHSQIPNTIPESLVNELIAAGYEKVDLFKDSQVTVDLLANMSDYGMIYFCGHGDMYKDQIGWVTGEDCTKDKKQYYENKYGKDSVSIAFIPGVGSQKFAVRPQFISNSLNGNLPQSFVYATACNGLRNNSMAQAFINKGAQVYIGWTNTVNIAATSYTEDKLFGHLVNGHLTVTESLNEMSGDSQFGHDATNDAWLDYFPKPAGGACSLTQTQATPDSTPPVWTGTPGITEAIAGDGYVTVKYGIAADAESSPVKYRVYYSEANPIPFSTASYISDQDGSPTDVSGLTNGKAYYFAVRAVNSASPALEDSNTATLEATPTAGVDPCQPDSNNSCDEAQLVGLVGGTASSSVCYPNDIEDFYKFTASGKLKGTLKLENQTGNSGLSLTLYSDCSAPYIAHTEANPTATINLESYSLGAGTYYARVKYGGVDHNATNYKLTNSGYCGTGFNPSIIATVDIPNGTFFQDGAYGLAVSDGYAYVAGMEGGLHIVDINPTESAHIVKNVETPWAKDVTVADGFAYIADTEKGLRIVDIYPPESAFIVKTVTACADDVAVSNGYAYVVGSNIVNLLQIIDIEPPGSAYIVKTVSTNCGAFNVAVFGGYAYMTDNYYGLKIIDVNPPESAYTVKTIDLGGQNPCGVAVYNGYAYVAAGYSGLQIIDIAPSESAYVFKIVDTPDYACDVAICGGFAYVTDSESGLCIIDIDPLESADIVKSVDTPRKTRDVVVYGEYAYVTENTDSSSALQIIDLDGYY